MTQPKIIVIEDSPADWELAKIALEKTSYSFESIFFEDGEEALNYIQHDCVPTEIHLILLDLNMPKLNGKDLLRQLKATSQTRCIPVVIFTSSDLHSDIEEVYNIGANAFITKPLDIHEFNKAISIVVDYWLDVNILAPSVITV